MRSTVAEGRGPGAIGSSVAADATADAAHAPGGVDPSVPRGVWRAWRRDVPLASVVLGVAWLAWFGVLQWSVVRFRVPILLTLTACALLLAWWLARRVDVPLPRWLAPAVLVGSVVVTLTVPLFSYVRGGWLTAALAILTVGGL